MHIAIITAGGAGMFCGSCMHDNTLARALIQAGIDVSLIPTYTPVRVDEEDASSRQVFFGGINVYLEHRSRIWRRLPAFFKRCFDVRWVINLAAGFGVSSDASRLGRLTLDMLAGESGPIRRPVEELAEFLARELKPDVVCFSNALLVGALKRLKEQFDGPVCCLLQGDDIFLEGLPDEQREQALRMIRERAQQFDAFLVHSGFYRDFMAQYLGLPIKKVHLVPLGIDTTGHDGLPARRGNERFTIGYFARICHDKGLHNLVEAFRILHNEFPSCRLRAGGYLGKSDRSYLRGLRRQTQKLGDAFEYIGSPQTLCEKASFLKSLDVLSVPTVYRECKGLYVLEALANGTPVVQPRHGAFPELIEATAGGVLYDENDTAALAEALSELMQDEPRRLKLGTAGHKAVHEHFDMPSMAKRTLEVIERIRQSHR